jgi:hypothetical protein
VVRVQQSRIGVEVAGRIGEGGQSRSGEKSPEMSAARQQSARRPGCPVAGADESVTCQGLKQPMLGHRKRCTSSCDDVIDESHFNELECRFQVRSDQLVGLRRGDLTARVIVRNDESGRIVPQRLLHDDARMNRSTIERAAK